MTPGEFLVGVAEIDATTRSMEARKGTMLNVVITDGTHDIDITFFKAWGHEGARARRTRHLRRGGRHLQQPPPADPPGYVLDDFDAGDRKDLIPIYRAVEVAARGPSPRACAGCSTSSTRCPTRSPRACGPPADSSHAPRRCAASTNSWEEVEQARRRLRYEEAFVLQVTLAQRRPARHPGR